MEQYYYVAGSLYFTIKLIMLIIPSNLAGGNKLSNDNGINDVMGNMMPIIDLLFKSN